MKGLMLRMEEINQVLNGFIWGPVMLAFFLLVGMMFTLRTGFFQVTWFSHWIHATFFQLFQNPSVRKTKDAKSFSQFQALCTALAGTMGTGNIAGIATVIVLGGPGAVFWMWVSAFVGMMTSFAEKTLGIRYRYKNEQGDWVGGAMVYMERGLHCTWLAVLFCIFCMLASFGIGNMTQANSIASGLTASFGIPAPVTAFCLMAGISLVLMGGMKRIAGVTEKLVPFMAALYLLAGLLVIFCHLNRVPEAFASIFREAFQIRAAGTGTLGYGFLTAIKYGVSRGVFSNEAGLGSSVMVHAAADVEEPSIQGMWGIFEVFADTLVVCTVTALVILTSGIYEKTACLQAMERGEEVLSSTALTGASFGTVFPFGNELVAGAVLLFAFSTLLGWSYYGERAAVYLFGERAVPVYKVLFILVIYPGCTQSLNFIWSVSDTLNGFMAVPNLIAITVLGGEAVRELKSYQKRHGRS